jgi:glutathione S-transferase
MVQVGDEPNVRAAHRLAADGLAVASQNTWPSLRLDAKAVNRLAGRFLTAGFYYKTFMRPRFLWPAYESVLRRFVNAGTVSPDTPHARPQLRAVHPLGKSPVITDGSNTIAESGAIIEYVMERYGNGRLIPPPATPERLRYTYWLHFAEGSAMPPLLLKLVFDRIEAAPMPFFVKPIARGIAAKVKGSFIAPNLERQLSFMEAELAAREWFAGPEFSAADIQMSFPLEASRVRGGLDARRPKLMQFLERIHSRQAYRNALARGGPYALVS